MTRDPDVLVVGAGPTGLTAALDAHAHGARVRLVERRGRAFRPSRAMVLHARALEVLRPLGVVDELLARADTAPRAELHLGGRRVDARLGTVALRDTAYPHLTLLRQAAVEDVLARALEARGVAVERGVELIDATAHERGATARLRHRDAVTETVRCRYVAGCDGPDSTVRRLAGIGWHGGSYREEVVLADLELDGGLTPGVLHVIAARPGLVFLFALGEGATWRLLATRPSSADGAPYGQPGAAVAGADITRILADAGLPGSVRTVSWSAQVRLQHRLAESFRRGRFLLAGDAAHAHSPAAAQGMNAGILDATNLGWKLAFASAREHPSPDLLDSYTLERRPAARQVLALTHAVFFAEASTHLLPSLLRSALVPLAAPALPWLLGRRLPLALVVRLLSQGWVRYRHSPLSTDAAPVGRGPHPGDRLPDMDVTCAGRRTRLHEVTARPGISVLLDRDAPEIDDSRLGPWVRVHRLDDRPGHGLVAVRPDGHVGFRCGTADEPQLTAWLEHVGARQDADRASP